MTNYQTFSIEELPRTNGVGGARFELTVVGQSSPIKPFAKPGSLRYKRTDYGGSTQPTFQVQGPKLDVLSYSGEWNDKYNSQGFAQTEKDRFLAMVYRGNPVRIVWGVETIEGLITRWDVQIFDDYRVRYEFSVDPARDQLIADARLERGQDTLHTGSQVAEEVRAEVTGLTGAEPPAAAMGGAINAEHAAAVVEVNSGMSEVDQVVEQRLLAGTESTTSLERVATALRRVRSGAVSALDRLVTLRADLDTTVRTPMNELNFDEWRASASYYARLTAASSARGERTMRERAKPRSQHIYRPATGESLYDVSLAVYGTAHHWREIADRNNLAGPHLVGDEALVIPELQTGT
jgi:hypothetical protein